MKLYFAPGACSIGIHVLLEEIGKPYEAERVNLQQGEQYKPPFTTVNPKSKVPTLVRDDGSVLTEFPAIAYWLARTNPYAGLLPDDIDQQARALELMDYAVSTIHMQGFARQFRSECGGRRCGEGSRAGNRRERLCHAGQGVGRQGLRCWSLLNRRFGNLLRRVLVKARGHDAAGQLRRASGPYAGKAVGAANNATGRPGLIR